MKHISIERIEKESRTIKFMDLEIGRFFMRAGALGIKIASYITTPNIFWIEAERPSIFTEDTDVYPVSVKLTYWLE